MEKHSGITSYYQFTDEGSGTPIILLYGLFGSAKNFLPLREHLKKKYRVIVPVFPFFQTGTKADIFSFTEYLHAIITTLNLTKFHLLGNSMGGHIAILYTLKYPEKIESLILSGSSGLYEHGLGDTYPRRGDYEYIKTKTQLTFYKPEIATKELVDEIYSIVNSRKALQIVSLAKSTIRNNVEAELHKIDCPSCLIWGMNDTITPPDVAVSFQQFLPKADLYWIDECGHVPMLERPAEFNSALDTFFQLNGFV
ncbi:MAG: alpha/beta hydrolase [Chitinophagaceae bacterium]|nr:alpha/beta hydrolase [Chitinophagaceae bacterium]MBK8953002.1 alpha/beta hydrolase [Chitinophagaceae bacterium]